MFLFRFRVSLDVELRCMFFSLIITTMVFNFLKNFNLFLVICLNMNSKISTLSVSGLYFFGDGPQLTVQ